MSDLERENAQLRQTIEVYARTSLEQQRENADLRRKLSDVEAECVTHRAVRDQLLEQFPESYWGAIPADVADLRTKLEEREWDMHMRIRADYDKTVADCWRAECDKLRTRAEEAERKLADAELRGADAARREAIEKCAVTAWSFFMQLAQKNRRNPSTMNDEFKVCDAIRALGQKPEGV